MEKGAESGINVFIRPSVGKERCKSNYSFKALLTLLIFRVKYIVSIYNC